MPVAAPPEITSEQQNKAATPQPVPKRFQPSKAVLFIDRWMTQFIKVGGISIIAAVLGIFVFIVWQVFPLFRPAKVQQKKTVELPKGDYRILGIDEWGELPVVVDSKGSLFFFDLVGKKGIQAADPKFSEQKQLTSFRYNPLGQEIVFGTADGNFSVVQINYSTTFDKGKRSVTQDAKASPFQPIGTPGFPIVQIAYGDSGEDKLVAAVQYINGKSEVHAVTLTQQRTLMGTGEISVGQSFNLTANYVSAPDQVAVNQQATDIVVSTKSGDVYYFYRSEDQVDNRQTFQPFADLKDKTIASMNFLFGGSSLVLTNASGVNRIFTLFQKEGEENRLFHQTKEFEKLPSGASFYAMSVRNKAFLIGSGSEASLRYGTTEDIRWQEKLPYEVISAVVGGKYNSLYFLDNRNKLHIYSLEDPHPESSFKALFGKVWYEGAPEPSYEWQSTGASDDFEPKLSMVPLIIGTLKGTFYAMLFATPIALLAAIYTS
ncbi:MAG TPA: hypothetical protein VH815_14755, partial [Acidobacteriota bacterium]